MKINPGEKIVSFDLSGEMRSVSISERKKGTNFLKKTSAFLIILVIFFFLGRSLYHNLEELSTYRWNIRPSLLILSFLLLIANLAISALAWKRILHMFSVRLPLDQSFKIMFVSGLGKYLPGKVWLYLSQVYLSAKAKVPKGVTLFSMILLFTAYNLTGVVVFVFSLFWWYKFPPLLVLVLLLAFLSLFFILFSTPILNLMVRLSSLISKKFKEGLIPEELNINGGTGRVGQIILILMIDWMIFGVAVYFLINSFYHIDLSQTVILCGLFAVSVLVGILSFFIPAGLGVREGVLSYLLSRFISLSIAILISLVMRIWITLGEMICFFIALKIKKPKLW